MPDNEVSIVDRTGTERGGRIWPEATVRLTVRFPVHTETVTGSGPSRAVRRPGQTETSVWSVLHRNGDYLDELLSTASGRYSDQVDASSSALQQA